MSSSRKLLFLDKDPAGYSTPVYLPFYHGRGGYYKSYADPAYYLIRDITIEGITLETSEGTRKLQSLEEFLSTLDGHKTNWVGCDSLTTFLRWFTPEEVEGLYAPFSKPIPTSHGNLEYTPNLGQIKVGKSTRIIQVNRFAPGYPVDSLEAVKLVADKMQILEDYGFILNPISPSATASGTLLSEGLHSQFRLVSQLPGDDTQFASECYYPLRQDNAFAGKLDPLQVVDMITAYLERLSRQLSYAPRHNVVDRSLRKNPSAHAGWYHIVATIPGGMLFPPLPYRNPPIKTNPYESLVYPTGVVPTKVTKSYLDLLDDMGLPYKIVKALQLVSLKPNYHPFWPFCNATRYLMLHAYKELYPVEPKAFYFTLIGHMLHIHEVLEGPAGEVSYTTSADYHPFIASTVTGEVNNLVYRLMMVADHPYFFSADGGGAEKFSVVPDTFRTLLGKGLSFNPHLKDKPGKKPGKNIGMLGDLIHSQRDNKSLQLHLPVLITPRTTLRKPWTWGTKAWITKSVPPSYGHRQEEELPKHLGDLEQGLFRSKASHMIDSIHATSLDYSPLSPAELQALNELLEG